MLQNPGCDLAQQVPDNDVWQVLKAAQLGTWTLDLASMKLQACDLCKAHFGLGAHDDFGYGRWLAAVHPEDRSGLINALEVSASTGSHCHIDYRVVTPGHEVRWVSFRGQAVVDDVGNTRCITGISQNVTARTEHDLRLKALADLSECINFITEPVELAVAACEILARTLGVSRSGYGLIDMQGETILIERDWNAPGIRSLAGVLHFRDYGSYIEDLKRGDTVVVANAYTDPRTAGTAAALAAISAQSFINMPVHEEGGLVALLYLNHELPRQWSAEDIALVREVAARTRTAEARRRAEIELQSLSQSLEEQVQARTQRLMATEEALRHAQKMEAVGQLTGGVAHDFNNLLTVIRSSIDLLQRDNLTEVRRKRYVEAIANTVDRASRLTHQLLAFARRQPLQPEVFDGRERITAITDMIGTLVGSRIEVQTVFDDAPCLVMADPAQFDTALVNVIANARDAMCGEGRLQIQLHAQDGFIAVRLRDSGSGIAPDDLEHIFEPFFTTKAFGLGTGLGLSQVFGFVKQSGGDVQVDSEVDVGTTFTLLLPRAEQPGAQPVVAHSVPCADGHGERVLLVEDDADVGAFATEILKELGYQPQWVASAEAALDTLRAQPDHFAVVFSDVVMPGMSGIDLARSLRQQYPRLPVILASGYSHVLAQQGVDGFELLHKPYSVQALGERLAQALLAAAA